VATVTGPAGGGLTFTWVGSRVSQVTDSPGRMVRNEYDTAGRLVAVTDAAGGITRYAYDSAHRLTTITDARGIAFHLRREQPREPPAAGRRGGFTLYYGTAALATTPESLLLIEEAACAHSSYAVSSGRLYVYHYRRGWHEGEAHGDDRRGTDP
jgi:YD repeat-containing protein